MSEYLDAENKDLNVFIVGPGWTRTKIHDQVLQGKAVAQARIEETKRFMDSQGGTSLDEIFECIEWLRSEGKSLAGGRNFSVVYDPWRKKTRAQLIKALKVDSGMYKLRRHGNGFMQKPLVVIPAKAGIHSV
jgi:NAD(P)-dependent dehydrogenase (short-subunit alcohol dehydrogenase family)